MDSLTPDDVHRRINKIVKWAGYLFEETHKADHFMVEQLAHEAFDMLVGPAAIHGIEQFKTQKWKDLANGRLEKTLKESSSD